MTTTRSITVGPFPFLFRNVNRDMGLPAHAHGATLHVAFGYRPDDHGFPSFLDTNAALWQHVRELTDLPFKDATNEVALERIWRHVDDWCQDPPDVVARWDGRWWLARIDMDLQGVDDRIGHDPSWTRYTIARKDPS